MGRNPHLLPKGVQMASKIEIFNLALSDLGMRGITSVTEDSPSAIALNNYYETSRDETFEELRWPFATVKEALVGISDDTLELEWGYVYVYPTRAMKVWYVFNESTISNKHEQDYEVIYQQSNNRKVLCSDLGSAYAEYTYKLEDTTLYPAKFVRALSLKLAANCAHTLVGDVSVGIKMLELYGNAIGEAKRLSYQESRKKPKKITSTYQQSR